MKSKKLLIKEYKKRFKKIEQKEKSKFNKTKTKIIRQKFRKLVFKTNNCNCYINDKVFFLQLNFRRYCEKGLKKKKKKTKKTYRCY